jgi:hypothetical protein
MEHHSSDGDHKPHDHTDHILKGSSALLGIFLFFLFEKIMQIRRARKEKRVSDFLANFFKENRLRK